MISAIWLADLYGLPLSGFDEKFPQRRLQLAGSGALARQHWIDQRKLNRRASALLGRSTADRELRPGACDPPLQTRGA